VWSVEYCLPQGRNQREQPGNCPPEIYRNVFSHEVQQQVIIILPPPKISAGCSPPGLPHTTVAMRRLHFLPLTHRQNDVARRCCVQRNTMRSSANCVFPKKNLRNTIFYGACKFVIRNPTSEKQILTDMNAFADPHFVACILNCRNLKVYGQ